MKSSIDLGQNADQANANDKQDAEAEIAQLRQQLRKHEKRVEKLETDLDKAQSSKASFQTAAKDAQATMATLEVC